jgi:hypothetical protein
VQHFWDPDGTLAAPFKSVLALPGRVRAWDVYLLYPPGARWDDLPPAPAYWQHQLGDEVKALAPVLDAEAMLVQARKLLRASS